MTGCRRGSNKRIAEESQLKRIRRSHFHSGNVVNIDEGGRVTLVTFHIAFLYKLSKLAIDRTAEFEYQRDVDG